MQTLDSTCMYVPQIHHTRDTYRVQATTTNFSPLKVLMGADGPNKTLQRSLLRVASSAWGARRVTQTHKSLDAVAHDTAGADWVARPLLQLSQEAKARTVPDIVGQEIIIAVGFPKIP